MEQKPWERGCINCALYGNCFKGMSATTYKATMNHLSWRLGYHKLLTKMFLHNVQHLHDRSTVLSSTLMVYHQNPNPVDYTKINPRHQHPAGQIQASDFEELIDLLLELPVWTHTFLSAFVYEILHQLQNKHLLKSRSEPTNKSHFIISPWAIINYRKQVLLIIHSSCLTFNGQHKHKLQPTLAIILQLHNFMHQVSLSLMQSCLLVRIV